MWVEIIVNNNVSTTHLKNPFNIIPVKLDSLVYFHRSQVCATNITKLNGNENVANKHL